MPNFQAKWNAYWRLMRADKPIGSWLLLWPTAWGLLLAAEGLPSWHIMSVFFAGTLLMRAAGCVINDVADRKIDGHVERTQARPIVSGEVSTKEALGLFLLLVAIAFLLVLTLNWQTVMLSFVALALAFCYPFMKRYTYLPQFVLGMAFSFGIPMAFMAIREALPWWLWGIYLANLLWTVAYDTMYAMVDRDDDLKIGVKSTAILFGKFDKLLIGLLQISSLLSLLGVYLYLQLGWFAYSGLVIAALMFVQQQRMISERQREACFRAFLHNNKVGMVITLGLVGEFLLPL
ncbi:4-hydroxybenzoate octaprenyltransferase [Planctobacterium marinum]|uniref:4-hydroxybenzoate octaprenyltransferase n=1 Tax=Planctobacterium marinum TaxID=1631968 RepID=A0AA48KSN7_9ALTE|nr:4-hydroxybenzoate octaprenyltransferase [Planctobacterium marinum]